MTQRYTQQLRLVIDNETGKRTLFSTIQDATNWIKEQEKTTYKTIRVLAQSFDRETGKANGEERWETISLSNILFTGAKTVLAIKTIYESFWNDLNPHSESIVFVKQIDAVKN